MVQSSSHQDVSETKHGISPALVTIGALALALGAAMSLMLVYEHITGHAIPGCGDDSPCAELASSVWGRVPLGFAEWPTSFLGFSYFLAALVGWLLARGALSRGMKIIVRIGAVASAGFCVIMLQKAQVCPYCLVAHLGNFAFWIVMELKRAKAIPMGSALGAAVVTFVISSVAVGAWDAWQVRATTAEAEQQMSEDVAAMIERSHDATATAPEPEPEMTVETTAPATRPATVIAPDLTAEEAEPFEGRYRWGPEEAPIRVVMFTSYQCRDCRRIESQVRALQEKRTDIAFSIKHFPFNKECNPHCARTTQPNACWAARAAEAAGMLWGTDGFWKLHHWLFDKQGVFQTREELEGAIREIGYDPAGFVETMSSQETLERIKRDSKQAKDLGLHFTPMIFVNGVELKGWYAPNALIRTVQQLAETNPPLRSAAHDHPPAALEKYLADWREQDVLDLPPDAFPRALGPDDADAEVVVWGDYREAFTTDVDGIVRRMVAELGNVRYEFRQYPFDSKCNPNLKEERHPMACRAAQIAEATAQVAGEEAFWMLHVWLIENWETEYDDEALRMALTELALDADAIFAAADSSEVASAITGDIQAAKKLPRLRIGVPPGLYAIPTVFINDKLVPRFKLGKQPVLEMMIREAAGQ